MTFVRETCNKSPWGIHALIKVVSEYQIFVLCKDVTAIGKTGTELFTPQINIFTTPQIGRCSTYLERKAL